MPSSPPPIAFSSLARGRVSFEIGGPGYPGHRPGIHPPGVLPSHRASTHGPVRSGAERPAGGHQNPGGFRPGDRPPGVRGPTSRTAAPSTCWFPCSSGCSGSPPQRRTFRGPSKGWTTPGPGSPHPGGGEHLRPDRPLVHFLFRGCSRRSASPPSPRQGKSKRPPVRSSGRSSRTWPTGNSVPGTNSPLSRT